MLLYMEIAEETYSASQAAKILKLDARTIRKMCEREELEAIRDNSGYWRVYQTSVHAKLEEQRQQAEADPLEALEHSQDAREWIVRVNSLERELGRLEGRLELQGKAESTMQEERRRLIEDLERERSRAERLEEELREARKGWWQKMFGG